MGLLKSTENSRSQSYIGSNLITLEGQKWPFPIKFIPKFKIDQHSKIQGMFLGLPYD